MKKIIPILSIVALGAFSSTPVFAEDARPQPPEKREARPNREGRPGRGGPLGDLSPEEREKLRAAMESDAVKQDAEVEASRKALAEAADKHRKALAAALVKQDPTLAPVIEKIGTNFLRPREHFGKGRRGRPEGKLHRKGNPGKPSEAEKAPEAAKEQQ